MATFDFQPIRNDGVRITLMSDDRKTKVSTDRDRPGVERLVRMLCRSAGLPEPWKRG